MKLVIADINPKDDTLIVNSYGPLPIVGELVRVVLPDTSQVDATVITTIHDPGTAENDKYTVRLVR